MKKLLTIAGLSLLATPALAHHPLGGLPMQTFADGLLSGAGHPVLGFDHLFFVVAMGIAALFTTRRFAAPAAYIAAMLLGCVLISSGLTLPLAETAVVASLIVLGGALLAGKALGTTTTLVLFAGFGLFHGAAFGGSIAAQEGGVGGAVMAGYLIGLAAIQYAIAVATGALARRLGATSPAALNARLAGAAIAGAGLFLALEAIESPLLALITA